MKLQTGDIILGSSRSQKVYDHAILVINETETIEAKGNGVKRTPLDEALDGDKQRKIIRLNGKHTLTEKQTSVMIKSASSLVGLPCGKEGIFLQAFDALLNTNRFTRRLRSRKNQVRSSLVAWIYFVSCKIKFNGVDWQSCEPDDIDKESLKNPNKWKTLEEI